MNKAEAGSDSVKARKKIFIIKKDANGKLIKAHPFISKGKKKILEQQLVPSRTEEPTGEVQRLCERRFQHEQEQGLDRRARRFHEQY